MATITDIYKKAVDNGVLSNQVSEERFSQMLQNDQERKAFWEFAQKQKPGFYSADYDTFSNNASNLLASSAQQDASSNSSVAENTAPTDEQADKANLSTQNENATPVQDSAASTSSTTTNKTDKKSFWQSIGAHDPYGYKTEQYNKEQAEQAEREKQRKEAEEKQKEVAAKIEQRRSMFDAKWNGIDGKEGDGAKLDRAIAVAREKGEKAAAEVRKEYENPYQDMGIFGLDAVKRYNEHTSGDKIIDEVGKQLDADYQAALAALNKKNGNTTNSAITRPMTDEELAAMYKDAGIMSPEDYELYRQYVQGKMQEKFADMEVPHNKLDYFVNKFMQSNLIGQLTTMYTDTPYQRATKTQGTETFEKKNDNFGTKAVGFGADVVGLFADPTMLVMPMAGSVVGGAVVRGIAGQTIKHAGYVSANEIAARAMAQRGILRTANRLAGSAVTFTGIDAAHDVVNQLYSPIYNEETGEYESGNWQPWQTAKAAAKGAITGTIFGATGLLGDHVQHVVGEAWNRAAGAVAGKATHFVGGTNAMVGTSVVSQILQGKNAADINWGEEYANAAAMQLVFDLQGGIRSFAKTYSDAKERNKNISLPQAFVLNWQRMKTDPYAGSFTQEEIEQFNKAGFKGDNGYEILLSLNGGKEFKSLNELYSALERVSQDPTIDTQAKYRLSNLIYGKVEENVRPVTTDLFQDEQGDYIVRTYDTAGQTYETRKFANEQKAQEFAEERRIETQVNLKQWAEGIVRNAAFAQDMQRIADEALNEIQKQYPQYTAEQIYEIMRESLNNPNSNRNAIAQDSDRTAIRNLFENYLVANRPRLFDALAAVRQIVADDLDITSNEVQQIINKNYKELNTRERSVYDDYVSRLNEALPKAREAKVEQEQTSAETETQNSTGDSDDSVKALREAIRPQTEKEVETITNKTDGNVYTVTRADDSTKTGHIVSGTVEITTDSHNNKIIANTDVVTVRYSDGTIEQLPARDLNLAEEPTAAADIVEQNTTERVANAQANQQAASTFYAGQEVTMDDGNGNIYTSRVVGVSEEGVEVEIEDADGNPDTTIIPTKTALNVLHPVEQKTQEPQSNVEPKQVVDQNQTSTIPNIDAMSADEFGTLTVEYLGNKSTAVAYLEAERDKAKADVKKLSKQKVTQYTDIANFKEQNDALQAQKKAAEDKLNKLEQSLIAANHYQTKAEQEAAAARKAEEEAKRAARRQTEAAAAANAAPAERWKAAQKVEGNTLTRTLPDGTTIKGRYVLAEAGTATPSHDPNNGWDTSNGYPTTEDGKNINDRDYRNDKDAQQLTIQMAQTYDGQAVTQVPVVSSEGIVYDGNGRTIAGNIAASNNTDAAYIQALSDNAANFGFTPEQVASMQHPRVYMQLDKDLPYNTTTLAKFNAQEKKTQNNTNRAISQGKKMSEAARDGILAILDNYGSLDAFFASEAGANDIVKSLLSNGIITQQEVAGLTETTDRGFVLSPAGKDYVTDLLIGSLFDEDTIHMLGNDKGLKQSILHAVPSIVENRRLGDYALTDDINGAISLLYEARKAGQAYSLYIRQVDAFDGKVSDRYSPFEMLLAEEMSSGVEAFRQVLNLYNTSARDEANGQSGLFEPRTIEDIKNEILQHYAKRPTTAAVEPTAGTTVPSRPQNPQTQSSVPSPQAGNEQVGAENNARKQAESQQQSAKDRTKNAQKGEQTGGKGSKQTGEKKEKKSENKNKIFTEDAYEAARRRMHERLNRLNAGLDPEMLSDGLIMAGYHVEKGARKFADFAKRMIEEFGDKIRPYLKAFYNGLRDLPEADELSKEMDDYATVAQFDVKSITLEEPKAPENTAPAQFKVGDKIHYTTANGRKTIEATIEDVNSDGTYNIKYEAMPFMPTTAFNISANQLQPLLDKPKEQESKTNGFIEEFRKLKEKYPNTLLLFRDGDFYEVYGEDAADASKILGITLTHRNVDDGQIEMAGFPFHSIDVYLPKLVRAGKRVAFNEPILREEKGAGIMGSRYREDEIKTAENLLKNLQSEEKNVPLRETEKRYECNGKSVVVDKADYKTYLTDEAKALFAELSQQGEKPMAVPTSAYISFASMDGVKIPAEVLLQDHNIQAAQAKIDTRNGQSLELTDEQIKEYAMRLLDTEHGSAVLNAKGKINKRNGEEDFSGEVAQEHKALFVIGRPAGGKSSVYANPLSAQNKARIIDSDVVKPWLDGFDGGDGAGYVQEASARVADTALQIAMQRGDNMVIPKIGGGSIIKMAADLRQAGYSVELYYNEVSEGSSIMRASARFAETGRYLSIGYLQSIKNKAEKTFTNYANKTLKEVQNERPELFMSAGQTNVGGLGQNALGWGKEISSGDYFFSKAEWKNNDVEYGQPTKLVWSSESDEPIPGTDSARAHQQIGEVHKSTHTKTGEDIWIVKPENRVSDAEFKLLKDRAKEHNGYYSSFAKNRGFIFKSEEDANKFNLINDEEITTDKTSADTEAACNAGETAAREAAAIQRDRRDSSGAEREPSGEVSEGSVREPEPVDLSPEKANEEVTVRQKAIEKIEDANGKVADQLAVLGFYEADTTDPKKFNESYGYIKTAEAKAVKDIDRLAKQLASDLSIEINGRKTVAKANIAPLGGEISFRLPLENEKELYLEIDIKPNDNGYYSQDYSEDALVADHMYWRIEDQQNSGTSRFLTPNRNFGMYEKGAFNTTYGELLQDIRRFGKDYLPTLAMGTTKQEIAKQIVERTVQKKKNKNSIADSQPVLDLFSGITDIANEAAQQEQAKLAQQRQIELTSQEDLHHGYKVGDTIKHKKRGDVKIVDFERDGRPVVDSFGANWITEIVEWEDIEPQNTNNNGELRTDGRGENSTAQAKPSGQPRNENGTLGGSQQPQDERPVGGRVGTSGTSHRVHDGERSGGTPVQPTKQTVTSAEPTDDIEPSQWRNTRNFQARGEERLAPTTPKARYEANLAAIRLLKQLQEEDRQATPQEMGVLSQYSGWGGLGEFFKGEPGTVYYSQHGENSPYQTLASIMTPEELDAAQLSRNSAYYTPENVINAMWQIAERLGFKGGNILEGSAGIGNIFALMPEGISHRSNLTAVEIDDITAGILAQLYPDATTHHAGFQDVDIPNNSQDLTITNVPFVTSLHVYDKQEKDLSKRFGSIHDFCIAKNIRKLKQGGLGIFITTSNTLDKSKDLRLWLDSEGNADVIGAFRLNNETFGGTSATSDIIVVRKRVNGQKDPRSINVLDTSTERIAKQQQDEVRDKKTREYKRPEDKEVKVIYNDYFILRPNNMGGVMEFAFEHGSTWRENTLSCYPSPNINQAERLKKWVDSMDKSDHLQTYEEQPQHTPIGDYEAVGDNVPYGALVVNSKGEICRAQVGKAVPIDGINSNKVKNYAKSQVVNDYNAIKQAIADLLQAQTTDISDTELKPYLRKLNSAYDDFVRKYGSLNRNTSLSFLRNDVQWASIAAIEKVKETVDVNGKKKVEVSKTDLFNKRVVGVQAVPKAENTKDGVILSMQQFGTIQPDKIAEWLGKPTEEVEKGILDTRLGFRNPQTGDIEVRHLYLSGNVREKLAYAEEHNTDGSLNTNIEELRKVIPVDIPAHLIEFSIGSTWIPVELYKQYAKEKYDINNFTLNRVASAWIANEVWAVGNEKDRSEGVYSEKTKKQVYGHELMVAAMNNVPVVVSKTEKHYDGTTETITDTEASAACSDKISQIKDDFVDWARGRMQQDGELADRVQKIYNERFNAIVPMSKIDDVFLTEHLPGQNSAKYSLYPHQQQAVERGLMQPLMLAHEVGTGKTISLISTAMEMRRLGTAKKPMIVVQNATTQQFVSDAKDLYPNAKILTVSERDRTAEGRQEFYAKIKYNDWDLIIIPQSVFDMIPDSESRMQDFISEKIEEKMHAIEAAKEAGVNSTVTQRMEKELISLQSDLETNNMSGKKSKSKDKDAKKEAEKRANAEARAQEMLDRKTDNIEDFDDMGIDALLIDEAHNYKHLGFATMMQRGVKGVDPSYSKRAAALYLKCQSVYERTGHKNVIFATGTPISNTAAEIWTFMKYLMPKAMLKENGIYYFDDFVHNFGKISEQLEFGTNGKFKANNRFAQYNNVPELMRLWLTVADCTLTREVGQVNDKVPELEGGKAQDIFLPQSPSLVDIMAAVRSKLDEFEKMSSKEKKEKSYIPLTMYGIAKRAAIDPRLVDEKAVDEPLSKTNRAVTEVLRSLNDSKKYNGTVAIFCDSYQNKKSGFNLFEDIKDKLTKQGVPANQIAIIRSEMTDTAKQKIFDAVREGDIRVIMGSTQTLGTGVNIQTRLHTLIHMDAPDRPMDYTQRNGRILRQGNMHKVWGIPVRVLRFGVEDSLDVTSYQRLKTKAGFIDSIMNGKSMIDNNLENRVLEDADEGIFDNPVAMLSGSQYALMKSQAERDLRKWKAREQQHHIDQILIADRTKKNDTIIAYRTKKIADDKNLIDIVEKTFPDGKVSEYNINGTVCKTTEDVKKALKEVNKGITEESDKLRADRWGDKKSLAYTISFNGVPFNFFVTLTRKVDWKDSKTVVSIKKELSYSADLLGEKPIASPTTVLDRLVETIESDVLSGEQAKNDIVQSENYIERLKKENELMRAREGKPFEHQTELEKAQALVEEYTEKMKAEMKEKEAKYATQLHEAVDLDKLDSEDDASDDQAEAQYDELDYDTDHLTPAQQLATETLLTSLSDAGIEVEQVSQEHAQQVLRKQQSDNSVRLMLQMEQGTKGQSSNPIDGAKVAKLLESAKTKYQNRSNSVRDAISNISQSIGAKNTGTSNYITIEAKNGTIFTLRLSNHNATVSNFDNNGETDGISIVISRHANTGINNNNGNAHIVEFFYSDKILNKADGTPIADIIGALEQTMYSGEYTDPTGLAQRQEVNIPDPLQLPNGVIYGYAKNGKIYLTPEGLNPNTPIHEYAHLWVAAIKRKARDLYRNLQDLFSRKNLPDMWAELDRDTHYANLSEEAKLSEIIARFSGKRGAERFETETKKHIDEAKKQGKQELANAISLRERMRNLLRKIWNWVGENLFHIKNFGSREEAADRLLYDLLNGTNLNEPTNSESQAEFSVAEDTTGATPHLTRSEVVTKMLVQNAKNDYSTMQSAIKKVGNDIRGIRRAMKLQAGYDRSVVSSLLNLYNTLIQNNNAWAKYMPDTTRRMAAQIVSAVGKEDISDEVNTMLDYIMDAQAKAAQKQWDKLRNTPIEKINISGVVSQGKVALQGQYALRALNEALDAKLTAEQLDELISDEMFNETNAKDESMRTQFEGRRLGYTIAQQHIERLEHLKQERIQLRDELTAARSDEPIKPAAREQLVDAIKESMRDNYAEQAEAYMQSTKDLQEFVTEQKDKAKGFIEKQNQNREMIRDYAAKDLEGIATNPHRLRTKYNIARSIWDAFSSPIRDLQSLLRLCGANTPDGEGYLYNHFMRNWMDGTDREQQGLTEAAHTLDNKVDELTHGKYQSWEEMARKINDQSHNMFSISLKNGLDELGKPVVNTIPLNAGNALYIYAVNKMKDGQMKLAAMDITDDDVAKLTNAVRNKFGQEILNIVDWIQSEYFSQLRNRYNPVHEDLFGAPMDAIENYFPLRINPNARQKNEDLGSPDTDTARLLTGTSTGAIKRRTRNSLPLDVRHADFFTEVIRHIAQMEHWSAFAKLTRDANILFSDRDFRNRIKGMNGTIYGKGDQLYNHMKDAFKVALGTYQSKTDGFSEFVLNAAKGVTSAKINFRTFTALKQLASFPAFFTYMTDDIFVKSYFHNWIKPHETMKWAKETLPNFEKRVSKRDMGDMRLMQRTTDWQWNKRILELSSKYGMAANVFFDTLTCATGARAVYDSKYAEYIKKGYSETEAAKRAKQDAEFAFNTSQQSTEGAFMAPVQADRNLFTAALTVFRTSNFQYTRNFFYAVRTLLNNYGKKDKMTASRAKQYVADGLTEEQARKAAEIDWRKTNISATIGVVVYGALLNLLWRLVGNAPYYLFGKDNEKKKELAKSAVTGGMLFSPFDGLIGGGIVESALDGFANVTDMFAPELPFTQDAKKAEQYLQNDKYAEFASQALSVLMQSGLGFDPLTAADIITRVATTIDSEQDLDVAVQMMRVSQALLSIPQSQYEQMLIDEVINNRKDYRDAIEDYARYMAVHTAPLTWFLRGDETMEQARKNATQKFKKLYNERKELRK